MRSAIVTERTAKQRARKGGWLDWLRCDADILAARNGCYFDAKAAEHVCQFFTRFLRHSKGEFANQPFTPLDWQAQRVLMPLYGWKRADGTRRFRRSLVFVPRKNGKSVLNSGIGLYGLCADGEQAAEVYIASASIPQSANIYNSAKEMVDGNAELRKRLKLLPATKRIVYAKANSTLAILTPDADRSLGVNASLILFDELVAQANRNLWDALRFAGASRKQPLLVAITTAGWNKETICGEVYEYACRVRDGHA